MFIQLHSKDQTFLPGFRLISMRITKHLLKGVPCEWGFDTADKEVIGSIHAWQAPIRFFFTFS